MKTSINNQRPDYDPLIQTIADYALNTVIDSDESYQMARYALMDALGCAMLALQDSHCVTLLGPIVPGTHVPMGSHVPGTHYLLDPVKAAFDLGTMIRWLDYNDTWLAAEWGHPSDNIGAILALADYQSNYQIEMGEQALSMHDVFTMMIKAYEIQGVLALNHSFNRVGFDHVLLVKLASTAVSCALLHLSFEQTCAAISHVWLDGAALRTYRQAPNTGSRKSWAAGDATSRAVRLALLSKQHEMGYPSALSEQTWGFCDVCFESNPIDLAQPLDHYVIDNILFKLQYPAEFHAQTALECAIKLHPVVKDKLSLIERIDIATHESAIRIISKTGELYNPADRDHCLQYIIAIALLKGNLTSDDYSDDMASDKRINFLREKMQVTENKQFSEDYLDPSKRSIANSLCVYFNDGTKTDTVTVEYPVGHRFRRREGLFLLQEKFQHNLSSHFQDKKIEDIQTVMLNHETLCNLSVPEFMELWVG